MKVLKFDDREKWLLSRRGKITGTRLKDIVSKRATKEPKIGFYELIAERLAIAPNGENPMERGIRLEDEAMERFKQETGKEVDGSLLIWAREDNDSIALSPDGVVSETEAVEVKCLSSALHIKAFLTQEIPDEYEMQVIQYFIVNDKLKKLNVVFYDPRIPAKDFFILEVKREAIEKEITEYLEYQKKTIAEVEAIVNKLTF